MHVKDQHNGPVSLGTWFFSGTETGLDYSEQIQAMQSGAKLSNRDYVLRNALILVCCATLVYATGNLTYLYWGLAYGIVNTTYALTIRRMLPPMGPAKYASVCLLHLLGNLVYIVLPILIWTNETDTALRAIAIFAVIGQIMQHLTRKNLLVWTTIADAVSVSIVAGTIGVMLILSADSVAQQAVIAVGISSVLVYYVHSLLDSTRLMLRQHNTSKAAIERQKSNAISQITSGVAHDFNNILTAVQGFMELAELETKPRERAALLDQARRATHQAIEIVAKMNAYVERSQIAPQTIDLDRYMSSCRAVLDVLAPEHVMVSVDIAEDGMTVFADRLHLDTALINLAQNAVEAMNTGPGALGLTVEPSRAEDWPEIQLDQRREYVVFSLRDSGNGIAPTDLNRVTEPFYTTKNKASGSGLGLSMVKGFARQSGGALVLRNRPSGGLAVYLILPSRPISAK